MFKFWKKMKHTLLSKKFDSKIEEQHEIDSNEYIFTYNHGGHTYRTSVFASSPEEAEERIKAQSQAVYDGQVYTKFYFSFKSLSSGLVFGWVRHDGQSQGGSKCF